MFNNWIDKIVRKTVEQMTTDTENRFEQMHKKFRTIEALEQEISKLKIEKSVEEEKFARREREVTHKLGLERMRQEQDAVNSKKEMELNIREKNISAEEERFKKQMEFEREQLQNQINNLSILVQKVFDKIPEVTHETKTIKRLTGRS